MTFSSLNPPSPPPYYNPPQNLASYQPPQPPFAKSLPINIPSTLPYPSMPFALPTGLPTPAGNINPPEAPSYVVRQGCYYYAKPPAPARVLAVQSASSTATYAVPPIAPTPRTALLESRTMPTFKSTTCSSSMPAPSSPHLQETSPPLPPTSSPSPVPEKSFEESLLGPTLLEHLAECPPQDSVAISQTPPALPAPLAPNTPAISPRWPTDPRSPSKEEVAKLIQWNLAGDSIWKNTP